ncbi:hypothetical protein [Dietzia lutea]|uniref:hypothetical protein n=1 Tax=Dietzia lutea TaxID=546160 RepID=UPI0013A5BCB2|nr:hypothetical protein [Dietzia lutea]
MLVGATVAAAVTFAPQIQQALLDAGIVLPPLPGLPAPAGAPAPAPAPGPRAGPAGPRPRLIPAPATTAGPPRLRLQARSRDGGGLQSSGALRRGGSSSAAVPLAQRAV